MCHPFRVLAAFTTAVFLASCSPGTVTSPTLPATPENVPAIPVTPAAKKPVFGVGYYVTGVLQTKTKYQSWDFCDPEYDPCTLGIAFGARDLGFSDGRTLKDKYGSADWKLSMHSELGRPSFSSTSTLNDYGTASNGGGAAWVDQPIVTSSRLKKGTPVTIDATLAVTPLSSKINCSTQVGTAGVGEGLTQLSVYALCYPEGTGWVFKWFAGPQFKHEGTTDKGTYKTKVGAILYLSGAASVTTSVSPISSKDGEITAELAFKSCFTLKPRLATVVLRSSSGDHYNSC